MLRQSGLSADEARRMTASRTGILSALTLAASIVARGEGVDLEQVAGPRILTELSRMYVSDIHDVRTRQTVEPLPSYGASRRPLLHAILRASAPQDALDRLQAVPFIEQAQDGLRCMTR